MGDRVLSPDGQWMWTGSEWIPAPPSASVTEPQIGSVQDSVLQTGDLVRGAKIDTVIINQSAAEASAPSPPVVPAQQQLCPNCRQVIVPGGSRLLRCQAGSCDVEFCTGCEVWWTGTPRLDSIAPLCRDHYTQSKLTQSTGLIDTKVAPLKFNPFRIVTIFAAVYSIQITEELFSGLLGDDGLAWFLWPVSIAYSVYWSFGSIAFNTRLRRAIIAESDRKHANARRFLRGIERQASNPFSVVFQNRLAREEINVSPRLSEQYSVRYKM